MAALGAVPKELGSEKVRVIHDGSYSCGCEPENQSERPIDCASDCVTMWPLCSRR